MTWKSYAALSTEDLLGTAGPQCYCSDPDDFHRFSTAFRPDEGNKWVLYHTMRAIGISEEIGRFDTLEEAQGIAEMIWRFS